MFKPHKLILLCCLFFGFQTVAQNKENKWVVGASVGVTKFSTSNSKITGEQFNFQVPRVNVSRYFFDGLTVDAAFAVNTIDNVGDIINNSIDYFSIDFGAKYDFGKSNENLVPYAIGGFSFVNSSSEMTPTLNFGGGGTFWLNSRYGVNAQLMYKYAMSKNVTMTSHSYFSVGIVYSLKLRTLAPRLWDQSK